MGSELAATSDTYLVLIAYWTVFIAELVGDKSIYTVSSLAIRFRPIIVLGALVVAFFSENARCCFTRQSHCAAKLTLDRRR